MSAILEKTEHNTDFHQIVDFLQASHIRYALTISPTVYVSHIRQFWSTAWIKTTNQETKILATVDGKPMTISESSLRRHLKLNDEEGIMFKSKKYWFNEFSSNIATAVGEGSANPTEPHHTPSPQEQHSTQHDSPPPSHLTPTTEQIPQAPTEPLTHRQYTRRAKRITQSKALSPATNEPASLSRDDIQGEAFPTVSSLDARQDNKNIAKTSALPHESSPRVTFLDADDGSMQQRIHKLMELCTSLQRSAEPTLEDAPITRGIIKIGEELGADKSTELGSNDTEEMVNVLSSMDAVNILSSGGAPASVSPAEVLPAAGVPTVSGSFSTVSAIFTTASVVTPYTRRPRGITIGSSQNMRSPIIGSKDKGKQKVVESEMMIEGLDRNNEVIAKHLQEYKQAEADLSVGKKLELISELVKYQDHRAKILKGMTLDQIKEKFTPVWKQFEDFVPLNLKEGERVKKKGIMIDQGSSKRMKTSEDVSEEELKGKERRGFTLAMDLVKETFSIKHATKDKEKELWVELKRLFEPDFEDQLWTHNQAFMHDPLDWKLYDTCGVHHVSTKDQEIFMLVERDYPLRRGLATVMISNKLQVEQYSQMAND
uniref:Xylulose kinase-1 n=1 Tax=Tanacetum cinerariifolium TaxID=118510 RepID=A0A6L2MW14_TANCI|nr:hypothetical protein [Tanacetum cinerariifolium]